MKWRSSIHANKSTKSLLILCLTLGMSALVQAEGLSFLPSVTKKPVNRGVLVKKSEIFPISVKLAQGNKTKSYSVFCVNVIPGRVGEKSKSTYFYPYKNLVRELKKNKTVRNKKKISKLKSLIKAATPLCKKASAVGTPSSNPALSCFLNQNEIKDGAKLTTYKLTSVNYGESCQSEERVCNNGVLSGSFTELDCQVLAAKNCSLNNQEISHGSTIEAFQTATVPYDQSCSKETRSCNNGTLSGTYAYSDCLIEQAKDCQFNDSIVIHKSQILAYSSSTVPFGEKCQSEMRTCENGNLDGAFSFASCKVLLPKDCSFNGKIIVSGASFQAYLEESVPYDQSCTKQTRLCTDGVLSGSFTFASCSPEPRKSCLFNGKTILDGQSINAFEEQSVTSDQICTSESRQCTDGVLSGSYLYSSCFVQDDDKNCSFRGETVANGQSIVAYKFSVGTQAEGCIKETRTCKDSELDGTYTFAKCTPFDDSARFQIISSDPKQNIRRVTYGNNIFVTAGSSEINSIHSYKISANTEGHVTLSSRVISESVAPNNPLEEPLSPALNYANGEFLIARNSSSIFSSGDGENWVNRGQIPKFESDDPIKDLSFSPGSGGIWLALGLKSKIVRADAGLSKWEDVTFTPGLEQVESDQNAISSIVDIKENEFFATGVGQIVRTSLDNGATWKQERQFDATETSYFSSAYGNGKIVSVGDRSNPDKRPGADRTIPGGTIEVSTPHNVLSANYIFTSKRLNRVSYTGSEFIAVGDDGLIVTSVDGEIWTEQKVITDQDLYGVSAANSGKLKGTIIIVGTEGSIIIGCDFGYELHAGVCVQTARFVEVASGSFSNFNAVAAGPDKFVVVGEDASAATISLSENQLAVSNTKVPLGISDPKKSSLLSVAYGNGTYRIGGLVSNIYNSTDFVNWNAEPMQAFQTFSVPVTSLVFSPGSGSGQGAGFIAASSAGLMEWRGVADDSWTRITTTLSSTPYFAITSFGLTRAAVVGTGGTIQFSDSSVSVRPNFRLGRVSNSGKQPYFGVAFGKNRLVAVGANGVIETLLGVGSIFSSTTKNFGTQTTFNAVTFTGNEFIAVGSGGRILASPDGLNWSEQSRNTIDDLYSIAALSSGPLAGNILVVGDKGTILLGK